MRLVTSLLVGLLIAAVSPPLQAQEWGDVTVQFIYDGPAPKQAPVIVNKDPQFCGKFKLVDESLVVNKGNGGVANVVFFIRVAPRKKSPPVHPEYAKTANANIKLDNNKCRFEPHIVTLRTTQTLDVGNSDTVGHNSYIQPFVNPPQNPLIPAGRVVKFKFPAVEYRVPACPISCSIHPWMKAYLVVQEHPYMGVSDKDGKIVLKNVPAGKWTFQAWQEAAGYVSKLKLNGKPTEWRRGRFDLTVKPGQNDLGKAKLAPALFKKG